MHPAIQPRLLWTISSHSNNPLQNINWKVSIIPETITPASSPFHQLSLRLNVTGSNRPMGNNSMPFSRFSFSISRLWFKKTDFQDQNSSRLYCRSIGMRVNTVEPNTMPRKRRRSKPDMACDGLIFLLCSKYSAVSNAMVNSIEKPITSQTVQALLWVMKIWYKSNVVFCSLSLIYYLLLSGYHLNYMQASKYFGSWFIAFNYWVSVSVGERCDRSN